MTTYAIYCYDIRIGTLQIDDEGRHRYTAERKGVEQLSGRMSLPYEMTHDQEWGEPIPFFKNSIEDAHRFGREDYITSFTNPFKMRLIS